MLTSWPGLSQIDLNLKETFAWLNKGLNEQLDTYLCIILYLNIVYLFKGKFKSSQWQSVLLERNAE
jgi:hypothetical protein